MICEYCKSNDHNGQPKKCPGDGWCDCQHRPVREIYKKKEETNE